MRDILAIGARDWASVRNALPGVDWETSEPMRGEEEGEERLLNGALHSPLGLLGIRLAGSATEISTVQVSTSPGEEDRALAWTDLRDAVGRAGLTYEELGLSCSDDSELRAIRLSAGGRSVILNYTAYVERELAPTGFALIVYELTFESEDAAQATSRETEFCRQV